MFGGLKDDVEGPRVTNGHEGVIVKNKIIQESLTGMIACQKGGESAVEQCHLPKRDLRSRFSVFEK